MKIVIYIAISLDGFIADSTGSVKWLDSFNTQSDFGYSQFIKTVDTVLMGRNTYESVLSLSASWCYPDAQTHVLTHNPPSNTLHDNIHFHNQPLETLLESLRTQSQKIWICGGADLITQAIHLECVDEYHLFIMPILLGSGIPLFKGRQTPLKLIACTQEHGVICASYKAIS